MPRDSGDSNELPQLEAHTRKKKEKEKVFLSRIVNVAAFWRKLCNLVRPFPSLSPSCVRLDAVALKGFQTKCMGLIANATGPDFPSAKRPQLLRTSRGPAAHSELMTTKLLNNGGHPNG